MNACVDPERCLAAKHSAVEDYESLDMWKLPSQLRFKNQEEKRISFKTTG